MAKSSFDELKRVYNYVDATEEVLQKIYNEAIQTKDVNISFREQIMKYLQKNMSCKTLTGYIRKLNIDLSDNVASISRKLNSFYKFLESASYSLTPDDAIELVKEPVFQILFSNKFSKSTVSQSVFEKFVSDNENLELLCNLYLSENDIEIIEDNISVETESVKVKLLTREEEINLFKAINDGDPEAKNKMIRANYGLVKSIAKRYIGRGIEFEDMLQEGNIGLLKAIERFDYTKGYAFSTYATWWIKQGITRAIMDQSRAIRIPVHAFEKLDKIKREYEKLRILLNREPTEKEIADVLEISEETVHNLLENDRHVVSLNTKIGDDEDEELENFIQIADVNVAKEAIQAVGNEALINAVKIVLSDKQYRVIEARFGLKDQNSKTLEEVAKEFNVTRERIRQIEAKALKKLENSRLVKSVSDENIASNYFVPQNQENIEESYDSSKIKTQPNTFDIKTINSNITFDVFARLLMMFPEKDIKLFTQFHSIDLKRKRIYLSRSRYCDQKLLDRIELITDNLKEMYEYFEILTKKRYIETEDAYTRVNNRMISHYIRFKFINNTHKELVDAINQLPPRYKKVICLKHGKNLLQSNELPEDIKNAHQILFLAYKKIEEILKTKELPHKKSLLARYPDKTFDELVKYLEKLPLKYRNVLYKRHGENLDQYLSFPTDKPYQTYYTSYSKAVSVLDDLMSGKENKLPHKKSLLARYPDKTVEELNSYIEKLPLKYRNVLYIRHGENLDQYLPFPTDKNYQTYYASYNKAISVLNALINGEEIIFADKKTLINTYSKDDLLYAIPKLKVMERDIINTVHGQNLDENNPFPEAPKDKHPYYYKQKYYNLFKRIDQILLEREERKKKNDFVSKLGDYTYDEVVAEIGLLAEEEQKVIYIRHGKDLEGFNPYPIDKPFGYYKILYERAIFNLKNNLKAKKYPEEYELQQKRLEELKVNREIEKAKNRKVKKKSRKRKSVLSEFVKEDILWAMQYITDNQKEVLLLRHGQDLDETIPWPKVPKDKHSNYYNITYNNMFKSIGKILEKREKYKKINPENKSKIRKRGSTIIDVVEHDTLVEIMSLLTKKQQEIIYLRHGENLDEVLPWPDAPEDKCQNYYYIRYSNASKKVNQIAANGNEKPIRKNNGVRVSKDNIINITSHEDLIYAFEMLNEYEKSIFSMRHGTNLDEVLPWPDGKYKNVYYINYGKIVKKIKGILEEKNIISKIEEPVIEEVVPKSKKKKKKKEPIEPKEIIQTSIDEKRKSFVETKTQLEKMKIQNFAASLYDKYYGMYGKCINSDDMKYIITNAIDSYSYDEGISLELATSFKIESLIILNLANQYKQNPDSDESLEILLLMEELFGSRIKARYRGVNDELISLAIEQTLSNYTGRNPFYTDVCLKIKKTL